MGKLILLVILCSIYLSGCYTQLPVLAVHIEDDNYTLQRQCRKVEKEIKGRDVIVNVCSVTRVPTNRPDSNPITPAKVHLAIDTANATWSKYGYEFSFNDTVDYVKWHSSDLNRQPDDGDTNGWNNYGRLGDALALLLNPQQDRVVVLFRKYGGSGWSSGYALYVSMPQSPELYMAHEMGHYFGLVHTMYYGNCSAVQLGNTDNDWNGLLPVADDDVHDTPSDPTDACLSTVNSLAVNGTNLFAGTNGGVFQSTTANDIRWTPVNNGLTSTQVRSLVVSGTNLFAGTNGGIFLSGNNGASWAAVNNGLTSTQVRSLVVSGTNLFAGTNGGIFLSGNNGASWAAVNNGLTSTQVRTLAVNGTNLFAGTNGGVFLSTNNGTNWTAVNSGLTSTQVRTLAVNGTNLFAGTDTGVFRFDNNSATWTAVNNGLANVIVNSLVVSGSNLFAGTNDGVFLSTNNGTSWAAVNNGLTDGRIRQVWSFASSGTRLYAATAHGWVIDSNDAGASWTHTADAWLAWWRISTNACLDNTFTINNVEFNPPLHNTMSYYGCVPVELSPDQIKAIKYNLKNGRSKIPILRFN